MTYPEEDAGRLEACPHCAARLTLPLKPGTAPPAALQKTRRGWGWWSLLKAIGFVVLAASTFWCLLTLSTVLLSNADANAFIVALIAALPAVAGMILGAVVLAIGRKAGTQFSCSNCGKGLRRNASVCQGCNATFS